MHSSRSRRRHAAAAGAACLLLAATAACGPAEGAVTPAASVESAVDRMTAEESATVIANLDDAPVSEVRTLLRELGQGAGKRQAERLVRAEIAIALEADGPLNTLEKYGAGTRLALALCLGDRDVVAYKSVGDQVFLRLQLQELARQGRLTAEQQNRLNEIVGMADELPESLKSARQFLEGGWVSIDPEDFAEYGWAVEDFTGLSLDGPGFHGATSLLDGRELRATLSGLEDVLVDHGTYRKAGASRAGRGEDEDEVRRLRAELPARRVAKALAPLLGPLGARLDPAEVPQRAIPAEVTIRRGSLAELRIDLGELTDGGTAHVPLRLRFSPGDVFSANPPKNSRTLEPQDLLAAALYGITRSSS